MEPIIPIIIAFVTGLVLVHYAIPVIVHISQARKLVDHPNERKMNKEPVPNLGGVALFLGITISTLARVNKGTFPDFRFLLAALIILFFIGIKDDILVISPRKKFMAQLIAAFLVVVAGDIRVTNFHGIFGVYELPYVLSVAFTLLVVIAIINALNLIDGIDGLAAAIGIVASLIFGFFFYTLKQYNYAILSFAVNGSILSFFFYNVFGGRHKIFMGDTGSLQLGLLLSVFAIRFNEFALTADETLSHLSPVISLAILSVPVFDMARLFIVRILRKKSPFSPDINHIHHKILKLGFSHLKSTALLTAATLANLILVFVLHQLNNTLILLILTLIILFSSILPEFFYQYNKAKNSVTKRHEISLSFLMMSIKKWITRN